MIDIKTLLNSFRFIIIPKYQLLAAYITDSFLFRRIVYDMICCPTGKACAAPGHTVYDVLIRNIHVDCIVNGLTHVAQSFCKALCLGNGPWKSVQYISVFAVLLMDAVQQHADGNFIPKIKLSENTEKITNPGNKTIYRIYDKKTGKLKADLICFADETYDTSEDLLLFDPIATWKKTRLEGGSYTMRELLVPVFRKGECIYNSPSVVEIASYCREEKETLWDETKRLVNPHEVHVDLSKPLWDMKHELLDKYHFE